MSLFIPLASIPAQSKKSIQGVIEFSLVNANTKAVIATIKDGDIIDLAQLSTSNLNILAVTSPDAVGSVKFTLTGKESRTFIENAAPYLLYGDANNVYNSWTPQVGTYKLDAIPYTAPDTNGLEGYGLTVNFEIRNVVTLPNTPELADINALLNYTRGSVTEVNVVEPLYGDYFVWLPTWPYTYDSVNTYPAKGGGFWQRKNLTEIDLLHCGAFVNKEADSANAWKLAVILADRYKLPINHAGYNTLIYPTGTTTVPFIINKPNIKIIGNGTIGSKITNPSDPDEGYEMITWSGINGYFEGTFDGGKDNRFINYTDASPSILVRWSGDNPQYYGNCINAQGTGVNLRGNNQRGNILLDSDAGYNTLGIKAYKNLDSVHFENIISKRSPTRGTRSRITGVTVNCAEVADANGGLGGYFINDFYCGNMLLEEATLLFEGAVTKLGEAGNPIGFFKNVVFGSFENSLSNIYTTSSGANVPGKQTTKMENIENLSYLVKLKNFVYHNDLQGVWLSQVENLVTCKHWHTNTFNSQLARGTNNIELFEYDRRNAYTPLSNYFFKTSGDRSIINIDKIIIRNNNQGQVYTPAFAMFQLKDTGGIKWNTKLNIGSIEVYGDGDTRINLHNGTSSERASMRKMITFGTPPPASIIW